MRLHISITPNFSPVQRGNPFRDSPTSTKISTFYDNYFIRQGPTSWMSTGEKDEWPLLMIVMFVSSENVVVVTTLLCPNTADNSWLKAKTNKKKERKEKYKNPNGFPIWNGEFNNLATFLLRPKCFFALFEIFNAWFVIIVQKHVSLSRKSFKKNLFFVLAMLQLNESCQWKKSESSKCKPNDALY